VREASFVDKTDDKVPKILDLLEKEHPDAKIALNYSNHLELLIATMLSAQCTDKRVNMVTETLFKKYKMAEDYATVDLSILEEDIKPTGFYRNKARNIKKCCQILVDKHNSQIPRTMKEMVALPGVARKTANIVLSHAYSVIEGIAVDTHVRRVSKRLNLTENDNPDKIERDLMKSVPRDKWMRFTDLLIFQGRRICAARKPKCGLCPLTKLCPAAFTFN
jgi:endonuclease-3